MTLRRLYIIMMVCVPALGLACGQGRPFRNHHPLIADTFRPAVVGEISGPYGPTLALTLADRLARTPGLMSSGKDQGRVIISGRTEYVLKEISGRDLVHREKDTGRKETATRWDPLLERDIKATRPVVQTEVEEVSFVWREASLKTTFYLADAQGRELDGPKTLTVNLSEKYGGMNEYNPKGPRLASLPSQEETAAALVKETAARLIRIISPYATRFDNLLDEGVDVFGEDIILPGVESARSGQWEEAMKTWQEILAQNPDHPSALYNLGLAYERRSGQDNLVRARELFTRATRFGNNPLYREALTRATLALRQAENSQ
ncbi:MAG: tetratricopeptide repeat protein [Thermodesulfobacteriota bacterium]